MVLQIVSLNANGLGDALKRTVMNYYRDRSNIICFQETHSQVDDEKIWKSEWGGNILFSHGTSTARGVCIMVKKNLNYQIVKSKNDAAGRIVACELENIDDPTKTLTICNIYGPNKDSPSFFLEVIKITADMSSNLIIIGDFNAVMNVSKDRKNSSNNNVKAAQTLHEIAEDLSLIDVRRVRNPEEICYSWMRTVPKVMASRIDYGLVSQAISANCVNVMYLPGIKSDHLSFYIAVDLVCQERCPGFWKFNNLLLEKQEFYEMMNDCIDRALHDGVNLQPIERWLFLKQSIITRTKQYSCSHASEQKLIISQLSEKILSMEHDIAKIANPTQSQVKLLLDSKAEIEELLQERTRGTIFRTKTRWHELGEKNTKFFYNLEKNRFNARMCTKLFDSQGKIIEDPKCIRKLQRDFYANLYASDPSVQFSSANSNKTLIPCELKDKHNQPFSIEELTEAIKQLSRNKTPGISGLTADFYKVFGSKFKEILHKAIVQMYSDEQLPRGL